MGAGGTRGAHGAARGLRALPEGGIEMTIIYCDLCGKTLKVGSAPERLIINEYRADCCGLCAEKLINFVKSGPWKPESTAREEKSK
jgi:hypothetical protein